MKRAEAKCTVDILQQIESIEKEVMDLKLSVLKNLTPVLSNKVISLKGILKGVDITDRDIQSAKKSLYGRVRI